jgi:hypothetical protein
MKSVEALKPCTVIRMAARLALLLACATNQAGAAEVAISADQAPTISACGIEFELPRAYKITRPKRSVTHGANVRVCAFDIVPARHKPERGECKDKEEGGSPPYQRCDWVVDSGTPYPSVQVALARLEDHPALDPFSFDENTWKLPNAHAGDQAAKRVDFFGKPAWQGEIVTRLYWWRTRTKDYQGIYAGSGGFDATLLQLSADLAVVLVAPPPDDDNGDCRIFCASLRPSGHLQGKP